ncbi:MAG: aminotransferase class V-fold PLP-dependent enzyme [Thaumarchaeota archaeon]|nr:aminotransferase class V-fold PLP-dependent enzyme [Nitrososphaerota archaeon]
MRIPKGGRTWGEISKGLRGFEKASFMDPTGREKQLQHLYALSGTPELRAIVDGAFQIFLDSNASYDTEHGVLEMEREVVSMLADLWGLSSGVGHMTSCGTESNILSLYAARKLSKRKGGSVVLPSTAHMSLFKGCEYLGLKPIVVPVDDHFRAVPGAMERAVTKDTVAIAATAGNWAWAQIDPIEAIGKIAEEHDVYFHVDAAYAGFLCSFLKGSEFDIPPFDLSVKGVSSMSSDPHKNGYAPFPAGAIVFRDKELQRAAAYSTPKFLGYEYETPGLIGTRPGYSIAATWAIMNYLGVEGYTKLSRKAMRMTMEFIKGVSDIPGLRPSTIPKLNFATACSLEIDMDRVKATLKRKGWLFYDQIGPRKTRENAIVAAILPDREEVYPRFLDDLRAASK